MIATLNQPTAENAKHESKEIKIKAEEIRKEALATRIFIEEAKQKLKLAQEEAEESKAAEARALEEAEESKDEFEALSRKAEESEKLVEKVEAALAQVEAVKASENEVLTSLVAARKEMDDIKASTVEASKKAEMPGAAKKAVENELRRWREREQKKAAEVASRFLARDAGCLSTCSDTHTLDVNEVRPVDYKFQVQYASEKANVSKKLDKPKTSVSKKALPNLSGFFHSKKSPGDRGSPSYLPGEN